MNKENIAIVNPDITCCNCLRETKINEIHIHDMGYGSGFDNWSTQINLCDDCTSKTNPKWWKLKQTPIDVSYGGDDCSFYKYEYEDEIFEYVEQMPLSGQELFWNRYSKDSMYPMNPQDWIDYKLGILSHEKCKEYGMYSPQEIKAYNDRFPNCKYVEINVYEDGSKGSSCFRNTFGDSEGNCGLNISEECYMCSLFEERNGEIRVVDKLEEFYKRETERLTDIISYATRRLEMIKNKTLTND